MKNYFIGCFVSVAAFVKKQCTGTGHVEIAFLVGIGAGESTWPHQPERPYDRIGIDHDVITSSVSGFRMDDYTFEAGERRKNRSRSQTS